MLLIIALPRTEQQFQKKRANMEQVLFYLNQVERGVFLQALYKKCVCLGVGVVKFELFQSKTNVSTRTEARARTRTKARASARTRARTRTAARTRPK